MRVADPEGTSIRPEEGFTVFITGVIDDTKSVQLVVQGPSTEFYGGQLT